MAHLARINIHPIKSFDAYSVESATLLPSGALEHDRRFALVDRQGDFINGKRTVAMHRLRSRFDPLTNQLELRREESSASEMFHVECDRAKLREWLTEFFGMPVDLIENPDAGFPDDVESPGPTVVSRATLSAIGEWFGGLSVDEVRGRFRPNLEIDGVEPFWEDRLVADDDRVVRFRIGAAELLGTNPCQRCPVPTRNPTTGEVIHGFAKLFATRREETLPAWAEKSRFDHFYRLATNTRSAAAVARTLRVGDEVTILGVESPF